MTTRIGVLGGTFDPIHVGHLVAAVWSKASCDLDSVLLVPAGDPWQKVGTVVASAEDRYAMVKAVTDEMDGLETSRIEIDRDGASVTADTLEELAAPDRELFLILGADAVANMGTWRRLDETAPLATIVVVEREGESAEPPGAGWTVVHVPIPRLDLTSSEVRVRLGERLPVEGVVPAPALRVIEERGLYTAK